jgi:hypothetical protein
MGRESVRRKGKKEGPTRSENQNINLAADLGGALELGRRGFARAPILAT